MIGAQEASASQELPIVAYRQLILDGVRDHRLVCIQGETGCGKSSMVPQFLLDDAISTNDSRRTSILVTQPRRLAAIALAKRVSEARGDAVGGVAGFKISGHAEVSNRTKILFVTTGFFLQQLTHRPETLRQHTHICLDEVHERDLDTDLLCLVLKLLMADPAEHGGPRLIIMSATLQAAVFLEYFTLTGPMAVAPPLLHVGAHRYPVEDVFLDDIALVFRRSLPGIGTLIAHGLQLFKSLQTRCHAGKMDGPVMLAQVDEKMMELFLAIIGKIALPGTCILVFLPGLGDITDTLEKLEVTAFSSPIQINMLHSSLERADQEAALEPAASDHAKIVLATNIAESSLTIPDVTHVVDFGMQRGIWSEGHFLFLPRCVLNENLTFTPSRVILLQGCPIITVCHLSSLLPF